MTTDLGQRVRSGHEPRYPQEGGDLAGVGVRNWDSHGRRVWIQPGAAELCGYYGSDAVGSGAAGEEAGRDDADDRVDLGAGAKGRRDYQESADGDPGDSREERLRGGRGADEDAGRDAGVSDPGTVAEV